MHQKKLKPFPQKLKNQSNHRGKHDAKQHRTRSKEYEAAYTKASGRSSEEAYKTKIDPDAIPSKYGTGSELKQIVEAKSSQVVDFDLK